MNTRGLIEMLAEQLDDFDPEKRKEALKPFVGFLVQGELQLSKPSDNANLHIHSFFSYNADGHSPTRIAWEARRSGLFGAGIVEFDVLDGIDEFLFAGDAFGLRTTVGVESRVFVEDYADKEINSPGEPGISYHMGAGFVKLPEKGSPADAVLQKMRSLARRRNEQMAERVNAHLGEAAVDYEKDVVPLTPSGNVTERHMLAAYEAKGKAVFPDFAKRAEYWASKLGEEVDVMKELMCHSPKLHELMRSRLMKRGGVGYAPPERGSFPTLDEMNEMTTACGALPCPTWLDGTSAGEADPAALVKYHVEKGALAINIIPDRNWNVSDPELKARKVGNLNAIVEAADNAGLVIVHGTERNKIGLPFVDDLSCEALEPIAESLRRGAYAMFGHTAMARSVDRPLGGTWANSTFGSDRAARNAFYAEIGKLLKPGEKAGERLKAACATDDPNAITAALSDS